MTEQSATHRYGQERRQRAPQSGNKTSSQHNGIVVVVVCRRCGDYVRLEKSRRQLQRKSVSLLSDERRGVANV